VFPLRAWGCDEPVMPAAKVTAKVVKIGRRPGLLLEEPESSLQCRTQGVTPAVFALRVVWVWRVGV